MSTNARAGRLSRYLPSFANRKKQAEIQAKTPTVKRTTTVYSLSGYMCDVPVRLVVQGK